FCNPQVLGIAPRLGATLHRSQSLAPVKRELLSPRRDERRVDALAAQQRLDFAALCASRSRANAPAFLGGSERSPSTRSRHAFRGAAARASGRALGCGRRILVGGRKTRRFRHRSTPDATLTTLNSGRA